MNSTAQLPGVNRPLSVELRLINFCSCGLDSQGKHDTSFSRGVLTKRSDFPRAKGAVRCSPFGGVEFGKTSRLGSLTSQAFTEWCKEQDIELRFIQPGKADQNCLHRVLQPDLSRRGSERIPVRLVGGGAG